MKTPLWRLLAVLSLCFMGAAKHPDTTVGFYTEKGVEDNGAFAVPVTIGIPPRRAFITKVADVSERDVAAIYLFVAPDGTVGCTFLLDEHGKVNLDTLSVERRGTSLVALVNGRQVVDLIIDKHITDGIITIPHGLTVEEGRALKKAFKSIVPDTVKK